MNTKLWGGYVELEVVWIKNKYYKYNVLWNQRLGTTSHLYGRILWTGPRAMKGTIWSPNYAVPIQEEEKEEQEVEEQTNVEAFN